MNEKIRIKDIAKLAGVSVGTVDRVLHGRPNVSDKSRVKIEAVLKDINYEPNMYASALASKRSYKFFVLMPKHESEAYWNEVEEGALKAIAHRRDFNMEVKMSYYRRFHDETFNTECDKILSAKPDGVVIVPADLQTTKCFTDKLHENNIPFVLLDSFMPDLRPLAFFGQDSFSSGYYAARMLMLLAPNEKEIMLMKQMKDGKVASKQQDNREVGFRHYMKDHFPDTQITVVDLPLEAPKSSYNDILEAFFRSHPNVHHCITLCSKANIVGEFLQRTNRRSVQIMGYDMTEKNADCLRKGSISFLIAQHAFLQGYNTIKSLFEAIVLKQEVTAVNYMPIELISRENVAFYQRELI